jgi:hypothetical protein
LPQKYFQKLVSTIGSVGILKCFRSFLLHFDSSESDSFCIYLILHIILHLILHLMFFILFFILCWFLSSSDAVSLHLVFPPAPLNIEKLLTPLAVLLLRLPLVGLPLCVTVHLVTHPLVTLHLIKYSSSCHSSSCYCSSCSSSSPDSSPEVSNSLELFSDYFEYSDCLEFRLTLQNVQTVWIF